MAFVKQGSMWYCNGDLIRFLVNVHDGEKLAFDNMRVNGKTPVNPEQVPEWFFKAFTSDEDVPPEITVYQYLN